MTSNYIIVSIKLCLDVEKKKKKVQNNSMYSSFRFLIVLMPKVWPPSVFFVKIGQ